MKNKFKKTIMVLLVFFLSLGGFFLLGSPPRAERIAFGVNFSQKQAIDLGLDWQETYSALLDDLEVKNLKIASYWDLLEPEQGSYRFEDLDWQVKEAEKRAARIILVAGIKTPRWPECHLPDWAKSLPKEKQQERVLKLLGEVVLRYENSEAVWAWQVENEPLFPFGECPWRDKVFLEEEIAKVKSLSSKPVIISDSGEASLWITAARLGDIVGTTLYREVWFKELGLNIKYHLPPVFYWRKAQLVKKIFNKRVIVVELQAEPWGPKVIYELPLAEQLKTMNLEQFQDNIEFAQNTGLDEFYFWGAEWWYWLKVKEGRSEIWEEARRLLSS